jgi:DNA-binding transcriptional ArsR family regulator
MTHGTPAHSGLLPLQFNTRVSRVQSWWAPVWRGLIVEPSGKHYRTMHTAVWLYLYLIVHADRKTGRLFRRVDTIAMEMGVGQATIRRWLSVLVQRGYVTRRRTGRSLQLEIQRWKRLQSRSDQ